MRFSIITTRLDLQIKCYEIIFAKVFLLVIFLSARLAQAQTYDRAKLWDTEINAVD